MKWFKHEIFKFLLIYGIFIVLPISLFIVTFVFPQVPMMTLGHAYDGEFFSGGQLIGDINIRFSNKSIYLSYLDGSAVRTYRSPDNGYNWINLLEGKIVLNGDSSRMNVYNDTIGIFYYNYLIHKNLFVYGENQGDSWSTPREMPFYCNAIAFLNSTYLIGCASAPGYNSTIYISKDLGLNWEIQSVITSYIQQVHRYTIEVTFNQTIYMYGLSSTIRDIYSIYRSADLGKSWTEIETDFTGGRLIMGADNEFYVYSNLGNIYKSTDECLTWSHMEVTGVNRNDISSPIIDINEDGEIIVVYTKEILRFEFHMYDYYGLDYFWVGKDIWTWRYIEYFFRALFIPAGIALIFTAGFYIIYLLNNEY